MYRSFNTHGNGGAVPIPDEIHNKIGKILHKWLADRGDVIEPESLTIYVTGEAETKQPAKMEG